ncbi:MAG: trypsin-like peptidase domain-containing protein [Planctomycetota bacterium]|jgi:S1-C subfamily serine protease|nr:trypsin-like peptidase domain-containing protein [Planctomycetota bacterium]MDP6762865.1 trypsin-like peptidase domain-containing protein [Planctomycetota bacterium]MDP6988743.1 trypsin-like peptidase domain-containing protein [Planctomycetota bacterium]
MLNLLLPLLFAPTAPFAAQEPSLDDYLRGMSEAELYERRRTAESLVVQKAIPAVVYIETGKQVQWRDFFGQRQSTLRRGSGSGAVIRPEGFVVTNYHVVGGADRITVHFEKTIDPHPYVAELVAAVPQEDLALLKLEASPNRIFPTLELGTSSDLMIGERVLAIGSPLGHTHTVSMGIISGLHRDVPVTDPNQPRQTLRFEDLIQTDASINFGNSGGPLLNINGELIGINSAVNTAAENIGFSIPVDRVRRVLEEQLITPGSYSAWVGFEVSEDDELIVTGVAPGSPASEAGVRPGDRVLAVDGREVAELGAWRLARLGLGPARAVRVLLGRDGQRREVSFLTWEKARGLLWERVGATFRENAVGRRRILEIERLREGGPAAGIGLDRGDLVDAVQPASGDELARPWRVGTRAELAGLVGRLKPSTAVEVQVYRERELLEGVLVLD